MPHAESILPEICKENVEWAKKEKRRLLRQRLEVKLAESYVFVFVYVVGGGGWCWLLLLSIGLGVFVG